MPTLTVPSDTWITVPDTGLEVRQESGGTLPLQYSQGEVMLHLGGVWHVRRALPQVDPEDKYYQQGREAGNLLLDLAAYKPSDLGALLSTIEDAAVAAHYGRNPIRYNRAKGMADTIREYQEARG